MLGQQAGPCAVKDQECKQPTNIHASLFLEKEKRVNITYDVIYRVGVRKSFEPEPYYN